MRPSKEGNRKNKNISSSPKRTRPVNPSGADSGSRHFRLSPPPSVSVVDREIVTEDLALFEISPKTNPRSFPYTVKQQCWAKAEKVKGRDPDRWRRDPLGNIVFRKLVGCPGCLCHDYDHITPYSKNSFLLEFVSKLIRWTVPVSCPKHNPSMFKSQVWIK
ncbi:putative zinc finger protein [Capsicum annuum]|nr:putative zinc finger protein [Capsicum annuum]KAF3677301.1 putative zinc finger protein [Capsicum annuum]